LEVRERYVLFKIGCEAGTYIRKFCFDVGEALCSGAHMLELRRTRVGPFKEDKTLVTLHDLKDAFTIYQKEHNDAYLKKIISPMEKMVLHIPKIYVRDSAVDALCHGADLAAAGICNIDARIEPQMQVAFMTLKGELIGFGIAKKDAMSIYRAKNGIMVESDKVFMERGTYPGWNQKK
jgi:H/ACA ribonucleoprotein complex subunit 4